MREFVGLVQHNLRQAEIPLDYGAYEVEDKSANHCKVMEPADRYSSGSDSGALDPAVITLGRARAEIQETAVEGDPISRAQSVKVVSSGEKPHPTSKNANRSTGQAV